MNSLGATIYVMGVLISVAHNTKNHGMLNARCIASFLACSPGLQGNIFGIILHSTKFSLENCRLRYLQHKLETVVVEAFESSFSTTQKHKEVPKEAALERTLKQRKC